MKKKLDLSMLLYSVLMTLLFIAEVRIPYHPGKISILLYSITPVKLLLCIFMVKRLDSRVNQGEPFGACIISLKILSCVFFVDFLANLIFTVPFPRSYESISYAFFIIISMVEFALNAFVILMYARALDAGSKASIWLWINIAIAFIYFIVFCKGYGQYEISDRWTAALVLLFIVREPLKIRIALLKNIVSNA